MHRYLSSRQQSLPLAIWVGLKVLYAFLDIISVLGDHVKHKLPEGCIGMSLAVAMAPVRRRHASSSFPCTWHIRCDFPSTLNISTQVQASHNMNTNLSSGAAALSSGQGDRLQVINCGAIYQVGCLVTPSTQAVLREPFLPQVEC